MKFIHHVIGGLLFSLMIGCEHMPPAASTVREESRDAPLAFEISFPASVRSEPASGRLLLFLSKDAAEPRTAIHWLNLDPVFAFDLTNAAPDTPVLLTPATFRAPDALAYPTALGALPAAEYTAQALLDLDHTARDWNEGPGNLFSAPVKVSLHGSRGGTFRMELTNVIGAPPPMRTNEWLRLVEIKSDLLSEFYKRDTFVRAAVLLPKGYAESDRRYPVVYQIPGFGGRHTALSAFLEGRDGKAWQQGEYPYAALQVVLDPEVPLGHSVFANSENNGPVGDALVRELIPALEARFRVIAEPWARVVTGHSSGGWCSLWLQVAYPDFFGGCWSSAPDPVDFRFFQTMNIYADRNGHWSLDGQPRGLARNQHGIVQTFTRLNHWEYVTGSGGQLESFNAVFSPRGTDGNPEQLMNKLSGEINSAVAESWKRYDIRLILADNWSTLGPKLHGKIHILCGAWDTYYLENGVRALADFLGTTDYGGYVEFVPGDHGSMWTEALKTRTRREIADHFQSHL